VTTAQWDDGAWGAAAFADSGGPIAHAVSARGAVNTAAFAERLSTTHSVAASGTVASSAVSIGYGPGAIHPVSASGTVDVLVSTPNLRFSHVISATGTIGVLTDAAFLSHQHHPSARGTIDTPSTATLSQLHLVSASGMVDAPAFATVLLVGHHLAATGTIVTTATASETADIPAPEQLPVMGIVNLIRNPAAVLTLEGWSVENGALLNGFDTDHIWFGSHSVAFEFHDPAMHERARVATPPGLGIVSYPGSILWGEAMLAVGSATGVTANVWVRAQYSDTTIVNGDSVAVVIDATGDQADLWQMVDVPYVILNPSLSLEQAWVVVEPTSAGAFPLVLFVGAAQIEYDPLMSGPSVTIALEAA
jgi:hypothetical protein